MISSVIYFHYFLHSLKSPARSGAFQPNGTGFPQPQGNTKSTSPADRDTRMHGAGSSEAERSGKLRRITSVQRAERWIYMLPPAIARRALQPRVSDLQRLCISTLHIFRDLDLDQLLFFSRW